MIRYSVYSHIELFSLKSLSDIATRSLQRKAFSAYLTQTYNTACAGFKCSCSCFHPFLQRVPIIQPLTLQILRFLTFCGSVSRRNHGPVYSDPCLFRALLTIWQGKSRTLPMQLLLLAFPRPPCRGKESSSLQHISNDLAIRKDTLRRKASSLLN